MLPHGQFFYRCDSSFHFYSDYSQIFYLFDSNNTAKFVKRQCCRSDVKICPSLTIELKVQLESKLIFEFHYQLIKYWRFGIVGRLPSQTVCIINRTFDFDQQIISCSVVISSTMLTLL